MKRILQCLGVIILSACIVSCAQRRIADSTEDSLSDSITKSDITEEIEAYSNGIVESLDTFEKAAQLIMPAIYASSGKADIEAVKRYARMGIGGIILLKGDINSAKILVDTFRHYSKVPPFIAIDAEWGLGMRLHDAPKFTINGDIDKDASEQLLFDYGREVADESRKIGINMILGPVLDVSSPQSYIGRRSYGVDPKRVRDFAIAYAKGLESGNVMSVAKHFPGHGAAEGNSHKILPTITRSLQSLDSIDLQPFKSYIANGLSGIMVGHLAFPAIDPKALPAALSKAVITDLLRTDLGFNGLVLTDALNMLGAQGMGADKAIEAGSDIVLAPADTYQEINNIIQAIEQGHLSIDEVDSHLKRIAAKKYEVCSAPERIHSDSISSPETKYIQKSLRQTAK